MKDLFEIAFIALSNGKFMLIDLVDLPLISRFTWHYRPTPCGVGYAYADIDGHRITAHRLILCTTEKMRFVDHRNGDGLDNRRRNIRFATHSENRWNQGPIGGSSKYKGVCWNKKEKKWVARIEVHGIEYYLGRFKNEIDAALAYDVAAKKHHGEFAYFNFPEDLKPNVLTACSMGR